MAYEPPEGGALGFDLRGFGYTAPDGTALAFNFQIRPPYLPPIGNQVPIAFGPAYQPPSGSKVGLEFSPSDEPVGDRQYLFPTGYESLAVGEQYVKLALRYVSPGGVYQSVVPGPGVYNSAFGVKPGGIAPFPKTGTNEFREVPAPKIELLLRFINVRPYANPPVPSKPGVTHWYQWAYPPGVPPKNLYGRAKISHREVYVRPASIVKSTLR